WPVGGLASCPARRSSDLKLVPAVGVVVAAARMSLLAGAALTLRLAVAEKPLVASDAVSVCAPALMRVAEKLRWPLVKVEFAGSTIGGEVALLPECVVPG